MSRDPTNKLAMVSTNTILKWHCWSNLFNARDVGETNLDVCSRVRIVACETQEAARIDEEGLIQPQRRQQHQDNQRWQTLTRYHATLNAWRSLKSYLVISHNGEESFNRLVML